MDCSPFVKDSRVFVPVRYLAQALAIPNDKIVWNPANHRITLTKDGVKVILSIEKNSVFVNDQVRHIDAVPVIKGGRIYLPARLITETFGYGELWDEEKKSVCIQANKSVREEILSMPIVVNEVREVIPGKLVVTRTVSDFSNSRNIVWVEGKFKTAESPLYICFLSKNSMPLDSEGIQQPDEVKPLDNEWSAFSHKMTDDTYPNNDLEQATILV